MYIYTHNTIVVIAGLKHESKIVSTRNGLS